MGYIHLHCRKAGTQTRPERRDEGDEILGPERTPPHRNIAHNKKMELKIPSNRRVLTRQERLNMHEKCQSVCIIVI